MSAQKLSQILGPSAESTGSNGTSSPSRAINGNGVYGARTEELILGAHRRSRQFSQGRALLPKKPDSARSSADVEMETLKTKLREQTIRLNSAGASPSQRTPVKPSTAVVATVNGNALTGSALRGYQYTVKPYHSVAPRLTWEPFDDDPDVAELNEKILRSEGRIRKLGAEMQTSWFTRKAGGAIAPPDPPVFSAPESDLMKLAAAAEQFAQAQTQKLERLDPDALDEGNLETEDVSPSSISPGAFSADALLRRRTSSVKVGAHTVSMLNILDMPSIDIVLPGPDEIELQRQGDVLGSKYILKRDLFDAAFTRKDQVGVMSGAPYFRMIPKFNIGGVAQAHVSGIKTVLNEIKKVHKEKIVWVNLREEAIAYINGRSYIIRTESAPTQPISVTGITQKRLESMEVKLKGEILTEAEKHGGNICVHKEGANGGITLNWEAVDSDSVVTLKEAFGGFVAKGISVEYRRLPIPGSGMRAPHIEYVFDLCQEFPTMPIVFNCQSGRGRSSTMMVAAAIVRFYQHCKKDVISDTSILRGDGQAANFRTLMKLVAVLPHGALHERRVSILCELAGKVSNLTEKILQAFKAEASQKAISLLSQFAHLICFSAYCEIRLWKKQTDISFSTWLESMPEVKGVLSAMLEQHTNERLKAERIATPLGLDRDVLGFVRARHGQMLTSNMILRRYPEIQEVVATEIVGVLALRQVAPDVPFFTCGNTTEAAMDDLCYNIRQQFADVREIHWFNVGSEPSIYVGGVPYLLIDIQAGTNEEYATLHATGERIEELEDRLKADVVAELEDNNGTLILHHITRERELVGQRLAVTRVQTPRAAKEAAVTDINFFYHRAPFPSTNKVKADDFQTLIKTFTQVPTGAAIIVADADGGMRTTLALNVACISRVATVSPLRSIRESSQIQEILKVADKGASLSTARFYTGLDPTAGPEIPIELLAASSICQMLAAGTVMKTAQAFISLAGRGRRWNILEALDQYKEQYGRETGEAREKALLKATGAARKYIFVLLVAIYMDEVGPGMAETFPQWCERLPEINNSLQKMQDHPLSAIKYVVAKTLTAEKSVDAVVASRRGEVLTPYFGLKADHFPGCHKKNIKPWVPGAPNFRKVDFVNVYGVAIPTVNGLHNVLNVLGASNKPFYVYPSETLDPNLSVAFPHGKLWGGRAAAQAKPSNGRVMWINLREEPLIYVGDRPFVFRDLTNPYVNVELTGIEANKIEAVEEKLLEDILHESANYGEKFIVHDEGKPGELVGIWELATVDTVKTVKKLYVEAKDHGARVQYVRLPVTDEQSPEHKDFDTLVRAILPEILANLYHEASPLSFVFNCQMGRGRTTTGMVICCLLIGLVQPDYYKTLHETHLQLWDDKATEWAKGHYSCILQLRSVLSDGRYAKLRVDLVLEACAAMQNLRAAIEGFKQATESVDVTEEARGRAHHHGVHYLQRYFNLIAFSSYLHEEYNVETQQLGTTFAAWFDARGELRHLHDMAALA